MQAIIDVCGENGHLASTLRAQQLMQMVIQGRWISDHPLLTLPHVEYRHLYLFCRDSRSPLSLPALIKFVDHKYATLLKMLQPEFPENEINKVGTLQQGLASAVSMILLKSFSVADIRSTNQFTASPSRDIGIGIDQRDWQR